MDPDRGFAPSPQTLHCVAPCPICGQGLCGIRICTGDDPTEPLPKIAFVMCDECEAVWQQPDVSTEHQSMDCEDSICPLCQLDVWRYSRWATLPEIERVGWTDFVDRSLDHQIE